MYDPGTLYTDPILTNFAIGFKDQRLYGLDLAPETPVNTQSGRYRVFDRSDWLIHKSRREPGTHANEVGARKYSEDTFSTQEHSLQSPVYDEERQQLNSLGGLANAAFGGALQIDPERDALNYVMRSILLEQEQKVANAFRNLANYTSNHKVTLTSGGTGTQWSNYATVSAGVYYSNPITDIRTAVQRIYLDTGQYPTDMIIPWDAVGIIERHPSVTTQFQYFSLVGEGAWKQLLQIPDGQDFTVTVVDSRYNSADNIDLAESIASLWGQDVWLGVVDDTMGMDVVTFAKTFAQIYPNGVTRPVDRWREIGRKTDLVRFSYKYDIKITSPTAGYLFKTAVAAIP
jgi:hypothetical protein